VPYVIAGQMQLRIHHVTVVVMHVAEWKLVPDPGSLTRGRGSVRVAMRWARCIRSKAGISRARDGSASEQCGRQISRMLQQMNACSKPNVRQLACTAMVQAISRYSLISTAYAHARRTHASRASPGLSLPNCQEP